MTKKQDPRKLRNLKPFQNMSDEAFEEWLEERQDESSTDVDYERFTERIDEKYQEFEQDYELSGMKFNDTEQLRNICKALVTLEDYERMSLELRAEGLTGKDSFKLTIIEKLGKMMSDLRRDIINMQESLGISRKSRKASGSETAKDELKRLTGLAKEFYQKVMGYVYCEECGMLISTVYFTYPDENNKLSFKCGRTITDAEGKKVGTCGHTTKITSKYLMSKDEETSKVPGTNHPKGFKF